MAGVVFLVVGWVIAQFPSTWIPIAHLIPFTALAIFVYGVYRVWKA